MGRIDVAFIKDYAKDFNIKLDGLIIVDMIYENNKLVSVKERDSVIELLPKIQKFKNYNNIETDDVITIIDMYFANELSIEYTGKSIFRERDKSE